MNSEELFGYLLLLVKKTESDPELVLKSLIFRLHLLSFHICLHIHKKISVLNKSGAKNILLDFKEKKLGQCSLISTTSQNVFQYDGIFMACPSRVFCLVQNSLWSLVCIFL